jgi:hypothetical protein
MNIENVQKYLTNLNIPYYFRQLIDFLPGEKIQEPHFIIPGSIILFCSRSRLCHSSGILTLEKKLYKYHQAKFPEKLHICIYNKSKDDDCTKLFQEAGVNTFDLDVTIVNQLSDIKPKEYYYCIDTSGPLYTLAMLTDQNIISKYMKYLYHVPKYEYDKATTYMNQEEIDNMNRFNIKIINDLSNIKYKVILVNRKINYGINFFEQFNQLIKYIPLPGGTRPPINYIKGHTIYCKICNELFNYKHINQYDICIFCSGHKTNK